MTNKYLKKISVLHGTGLQKESSLVAAGALHILQNLTTKAALGSRKAGQRIAQSFQHGLSGVHEGSLRRRAVSAGASIMSPEMESLYREANSIGHHVSQEWRDLHPRTKVILRKITRGEVADPAEALSKARISQEHKDKANAFLQKVKENMSSGDSSLSKAVGHLPSAEELKGKEESIKELFNSRHHPLFKNYLAELGKKQPPPKVPVPGPMRDYTPAALNAPLAAVDPYSAAFNLAKTVPIIHSISQNKYAKKAIGKINKVFVTDPLKSAVSKPEFNPGVGGRTVKRRILNMLDEYVVNPLAHSAKNTASTVSFIARGKKD